MFLSFSVSFTLSINNNLAKYCHFVIIFIYTYILTYENYSLSATSCYYYSAIVVPVQNLISTLTWLENPNQVLSAVIKLGRRRGWHFFHSLFHTILYRYTIYYII